MVGRLAGGSNAGANYALKLITLVKQLVQLSLGQHVAILDDSKPDFTLIQFLDSDFSLCMESDAFSAPRASP